MPHQKQKNSFKERTQALLGETSFAALDAALQEEAPVSIRINPKKQALTPDHAPIPWCQTGYYLSKRPAFTLDPLLHAGTYYVQEASSMFLEQAVKQYISEPIRCLDLCAAPGGKSTLLLETLPEKSLLVSNEVIRSRSHILSENCTKWGSPYSITTNNDPESFSKLPHFFDLVVADLPCSGEGMFRKDADSIGEWSVDNVKLCAARQRRIIHDCWETLKPGGILAYCTCTYNTEENEENIQYIVDTFGAKALPIETKPEWNISPAIASDLPVYRFFPHKTKGEGFFLALLQKESASTAPSHPPKKQKKAGKKAPLIIPPLAHTWLANDEDFQYDRQGDHIFAIPSIHWNNYSLLTKHLYIVSAGVRIGELKGKDLVPSHSLAMSIALAPSAFPTAELSYTDAISYLRKEALQLPAECPKGYVLVTYQNHPLGFVKQLGNRANNLYPQEWRIRKKP